MPSFSIQELQVLSIFVISIASFLGVIAPSGFFSSFVLTVADDSLGLPTTRDLSMSIPFKVVKIFSGGLILAVGLIHLLPDGRNKLENDQVIADTNGYPLIEAVFLGGIILTIAIEQIIAFVTTPALMEGERSVHSQDITEEQIESGMVVHFHHHPKASTFTSLLLFGSSILLHSIIIGFGLGSQTDGADAVEALLIALVFHQFFEGFSLGLLLRNIIFIPDNKLYDAVIRYFIGGLFVISTPLGIAIGMTAAESSTGDLICGVANGVAAGCLTYIALVEIISEELSKVKQTDAPYLRPLMCISALLGATSMAVLAMWA